jgi:signal transduction histidine kinase/CheY-like chemotaxis protein/HAMP domain-containing protein
MGFGLLFIMLAALIGAVAHWQAESAREQRIFTEQILPRTSRAGELERAILYTAIHLRSYLLSGGQDRLQQYREQADGMRRTLASLGQLSKDREGQLLYQALEPAVQRYVAVADAIAASPGARQYTWTAADAELTAIRETAVARVRDFVRYQDRQADVALEGMSNALRKVSDGIRLASALALLLFLALAYFTTQSIRRPTRELLRLARSLNTGDLVPALAWAPADRAAGEPSVAPRSEMLQLAHAFGAAAVALHRREQRLRAHRELANTAAGSLDKQKIAAGTLGVMVEHLGAEVGVLYWKDASSERLIPLASYGVEEVGASLRIGEGLPGEAASSRKLVVARDIPSDSPFTVKLGYDAAPPRSAAAVPIVFRGDVLGVMLVATLKALDEDALSFLDAVGPEIGVGLHNAKAYEDICNLLEQVQEKNQRIEQQNEELQAQNEEIQAQHEEIQAQHEEIQTQSEELQRQNDQLRTDAGELNERAAMLSQADERKNEFLGFLAHELRNPVSAIANGLFVLERVEPGSDKARSAQTIMHRQTRQLTRLIDDLLDTTRISRGKIELERQPLDFIDVARECLADYQLSIDTRSIALDVQLPDESAWVNGDRTRLCQIIGNLLSNAVKFCEDGARVSVRVLVDRARGSIELRMSDTGCGIEPALLPRLFTPFTQGSSTLARTKGGLGLGLALVKSLVELHDGAVNAYSDGPGHGSVFVVRLPLAEPPTRTAVQPILAPRSWRVLIVEDNRDAADTLRTGAELQGYDVRVAYDGKTCLEIARHFRPQVVLCDIGLPDIDGYEVARRLRSDPELRDLRIIAVSGYAAPHDKARAVAAGFDCHVAKPLEMDHLESMLSELEAGSRGSAPGAMRRA